MPILVGNRVRMRRMTFLLMLLFAAGTAVAQLTPCSMEIRLQADFGVTQSSTDTFTPDLAIDGQSDTCSQTTSEVYPHWTVDLGNTYTVSKLQVDSTMAAIGPSNLDVYFGTQMPLTDVIQYIGGKLDDIHSIVINDGEGLPTRYIMLKISAPTAPRILQLCEVMIFVKGLENVAFNKDSTMSSAGAIDDPATAVDVDLSTCTHSGVEAMPWWQVDLAEDAVIDHVVVHPSSGGVMSDVEIQLSEDSVTFTTAATASGPATDTMSFTFSPHVTARYMRIQATNQVRLCDVKVYALCEQTLCGSDIYNPEIELCCNGTVIQMESNITECCVETNETSCCGFKPYNLTSEVCCGSTVATADGYINDDTSTACCNATNAYFYPAQLCCDDEIVNKTTENSSCCGNLTFDSLVEVCCPSFTILPLIEENATTCCGNMALFNTEMQMCCDEANSLVVDLLAENHTECCGNTSFNPLFEVCCQSHSVLTIENENATVCCGDTELYNPHAQLCCDANSSIVLDLLADNHSACCGNGTYNPLTDVCCRLQSIITIENENATTCCGDSVLYNPDEQLCCDESTSFVVDRLADSHNACCGNNSYDPLVDVCCPSLNLFEIENENATTCCGDAGLYNPAVELCCNTNVPAVMDLQANDHTACCGNSSYNPHTQVCCPSLIILQIENENATVCCGDYVLYNPEDQLCCDENSAFVIEQLEDSHTSCCGNSSYDPLTEICCPTLNLVKIENENATVCCGDTELYNPHAQLCCDANSSIVLDLLADNHSACCGNGTYNPLTDVCCRLQSIITIENENATTCCGDSVLYNPDEQLCCDESTSFVVDRLADSHNACCGNNSYDPLVGVCCPSLNLFEIENENATTCCGDAGLYNPAVELCCNTNVPAVMDLQANDHTACCGNSSYNPFTQVCCPSLSVLPIENENATACCGDYVLYNPDQQLCCDAINSIVVDLLADNHTDCCGNISYHPLTSVCCPNFNLLPIENEHAIMCCGDTHLYAADVQLCCNTTTPVVIDMLADDHTACCGLDSYNPRTEVCCPPISILSIENENATTCCGLSALYNPDEQLCCDEINSLVIDLLADNHTECCSGISYNTLDYVCCSDNALVPIEDPSLTDCCNTTLYNDDVSVCCNGNVVPIVNLNELQCCNNTALYDPTSHVCCDGAIQPSHGASSTHCCGQSSYDSRCYYCEHGVVLRNFDSDTHMCCEGALHRKIYHQSCCCGEHYFDSTVSICINGTINDRTECDVAQSSCCHCQEKRIDVAIVVDNSESVRSIHSNLVFLKSFITELIGDSNVDNRDVRFALSLFTHDVYNEFYLNTYLTVAELISHVEMVEQLPGGTNTGGAIDNLITNVFVGANGNRIGIPKLAILITDGQSNNSTYTLDKAKTAKAQGIHLVVIGVGNVDTTEFYEIASDPKSENVFLIETYEDLSSVKARVETMFIAQCMDKPEESWCNSVRFEPLTKVCCSDMLLSIQDPDALTCCEQNSLYNANTAVCCNGNVVNITDPAQRECCKNTTLYNSTNQLCCNGNAVDMRSPTATACCDVTTYDPDYELCCHGVPQLKTSPTADTCCGSTTYDMSLQLCCGEVVVDADNIDSDRCCGDGVIVTSYNPSTEVCCGNTALLIVNAWQTECCGTTQLYNSALQVCCNDLGVDIVLSRQTASDDSCCANTAFNSQKEICCNEKVVSKQGRSSALCCGDESIYNPLYELCCSGSPVLKSDTADNACCGTSTYMQMSAICCDDNVVVMTSPTSTSCCGSVSFDPLTQVCCDSLNTVTKTSDTQTECCGTFSLYNPETQTCCGKDVVDLNYSCCNNQTPFDPMSQICCGNNVQPLLHHSMTLCCGSLSYDSTCHTCDSSTMEIVEAFDDTTEICCEGNIQKKIHEYTCCCGNQIIDAVTTECCNEVPQPRTELLAGEELCCHCINKKVDVALVVDTSESVLERDWPVLKDFLKDVIAGSDVDRGNTHIALSRFTHNVFNDFFLKTFDTKSQMIAHIKSINRTFGGTNTGEALKNMVQTIFVPENGDRLVAPNLALVITDGRSNNNYNTVYWAAVARELDITIIPIGVSLVDTTELYQIATDRENVFTVSDFSHLVTIEDIISKLFFEECTGKPKESFCNGQRFNPKLHICCNKHLVTITNPLASVCCGDNSVYNDQEAVCCNSKIIPITNPTRTECCGDSILFNSDFQICCDKYAVDKRGAKTTECCNKTSYDPNSELCCSGTPRQKSTPTSDGCCGDTTYDKLHQLCCDSIPVHANNVDTDSCCGNGYFVTSYNPTTQVCCSGNPVSIISLLQRDCCGTRKLYNHTTQICCPGSEIILGRQSPRDDSCCGRISFDSSRHICCSDTINAIDGRVHALCCGENSAFDPMVEVCCSGTPVMKGTSSANACCGLSNTYNDKTHICCDGTVVKMDTPHSNQCCGTYSFNPSNQICCEGSRPVTQLNPDMTHCCGVFNLYNPVSQSCCGVEVINSNKLCCNGMHPYDPLTQVCCGNSVQPRHGSHTACCGTTSYDSKCQKCKNTSMTVMPAFDPDTEICCDGNTQPKIYKYTCCCGHQTIDASVTECCNGLPQPRTSVVIPGETLCCHCINKKVDVAIVVDTSESVEENDWPILQHFLTDVVDSSDVDRGNTHFALSTFTHEVSNEFLFNTYETADQMIAHIEYMARAFGGTNTGLAIRNMVQTMFIPSKGDRLFAPNLALIITDGHSNNNTDTVRWASIAKQSGIHILAIGVGVIDTTELEQIASEPSNDNVFTVSDFRHLYSIENIISDLFYQECTEFPETVLCGYLVYDPASHVCCNYDLIQITDSDATSCCGHMLYNPSSELCCDGTAVFSENPTVDDCCNATNAYNPELQLCCSNKVVNKSTHRTTECCGTIAYSNHSHLCCFDNQVIQKDATHHTSCCDGSASYNPHIELCCQGTAVRKSSNNANTCCGTTETYDHTKQVCCGAVVLTITDINQITCCGTKLLYDPLVEICCEEEETVTVPIRPESPTATKCCDAKSAYDPDDEICCNGTPVSKEYRTNADCCGTNSSYDPNQEICCHGNAIVKPYVSATQCCGHTVAFDPNQHICCGDDIVPKRSNLTTSCCGWSSMDPVREICCDGNPVEKRNSDTTHCCSAYAVYDPENERCCGEHAITSSEGCCADSIPFDLSSEICCDAAIQPRFDQNTLCCGKISYDPWCNICLNDSNVEIFDEEKHICCEGKLHPLTYDSSCCCGYDVIDSSQFTCCGDISRPRNKWDLDGCCHCVNRKVDVAILADTSESIKTLDGKLEALLDFIKGIITDSDVDSGNVRFSLTFFHHDVTNVFHFNTHATTAAMINAIDTMDIRLGGTDTGKGLRYLRTVAFTEANGDRLNVPDIVLVITDGRSNDHDLTVQQSALLKANKGVHVITVGIGLTDKSELHQLASDPSQENVFSVDDFNNLSSLKQRIESLFIGECADKPTERPGGKMCGTKTFYPTNNICCLGSVQPRVGGNSTKCCGSTSFNPSLSLCCDGSVVSKFVGERTECCGHNAYDATEFLCCKGHIKARPAGQRAECCDKKVFNPKQSVCCDGHVEVRHGSNTECCGEKSYSSDCYSCFNQTVVAVFDEATALCCNGHIMNRRYGDNSCCCKDRQINLASQLCCDGRALDVPAYSPCACCGRRLYNVKDQICCDGRRRKKKYGDDTKCCRRHKMSSTDHLCCANSVVTKRTADDYNCCGSLPQNPQTELCCNGVINQLPSGVSITDSECCRSDIYQRDTQICCNGVVYDKASNSTSCCGIHSYNPNFQTCNADKVLHVESDSSGPKCEGKSYDPRIGLCCMNKLHLLTLLNYASCCNDQSYDVGNQTCCNGALFGTVPGKKIGCCSNTAYDLKTHLCCNGQKVRKSKTIDDTCCGIKRSYNSRVQMCCNGRVQYKICGEHTQCCHKKSFDPFINVCCSKTVRRKKYGNLTACCSWHTFNPVLHKCCDGHVVEKEKSSLKQYRRQSKSGTERITEDIPDDTDDEYGSQVNEQDMISLKKDDKQNRKTIINLEDLRREVRKLKKQVNDNKTAETLKQHRKTIKDLRRKLRKYKSVKCGKNLVDNDQHNTVNVTEVLQENKKLHKLLRQMQSKLRKLKRSKEIDNTYDSDETKENEKKTENTLMKPKEKESAEITLFPIQRAKKEELYSKRRNKNSSFHKDKVGKTVRFIRKKIVVLKKRIKTSSDKKLIKQLKRQLERLGSKLNKLSNKNKTSEKVKTTNVKQKDPKTMSRDDGKYNDKNIPQDKRVRLRRIKNKTKIEFKKELHKVDKELDEGFNSEVRTPSFPNIPKTIVKSDYPVLEKDITNREELHVIQHKLKNNDKRAKRLVPYLLRKRNVLESRIAGTKDRRLKRELKQKLKNLQRKLLRLADFVNSKSIEDYIEFLLEFRYDLKELLNKMTDDVEKKKYSKLLKKTVKTIYKLTTEGKKSLVKYLLKRRDILLDRKDTIPGKRLRNELQRKIDNIDRRLIDMSENIDQTDIGDLLKFLKKKQSVLAQRLLQEDDKEIRKEIKNQLKLVNTKIAKLTSDDNDRNSNVNQKEKSDKKVLRFNDDQPPEIFDEGTDSNRFPNKENKESSTVPDRYDNIETVPDTSLINSNIKDRYSKTGRSKRKPDENESRNTAKYRTIKKKRKDKPVDKMDDQNQIRENDAKSNGVIDEKRKKKASPLNDNQLYGVSTDDDRGKTKVSKSELITYLLAKVDALETRKGQTNNIPFIRKLQRKLENLEDRLLNLDQFIDDDLLEDYLEFLLELRYTIKERLGDSEHTKDRELNTRKLENVRNLIIGFTDDNDYDLVKFLLKRRDVLANRLSDSIGDNLKKEFLRKIQHIERWLVKLSRSDETFDIADMVDFLRKKQSALKRKILQENSKKVLRQLKKELENVQEILKTLSIKNKQNKNNNNEEKIYEQKKTNRKQGSKNDKIKKSTPNNRKLTKSDLIDFLLKKRDMLETRIYATNDIILNQEYIKKLKNAEERLLKMFDSVRSDQTEDYMEFLLEFRYKLKEKLQQAKDKQNKMDIAQLLKAAVDLIYRLTGGKDESGVGFLLKRRDILLARFKDTSDKILQAEIRRKIESIDRHLIEMSLSVKKSERADIIKFLNMKREALKSRIAEEDDMTVKQQLKKKLANVEERLQRLTYDMNVDEDEAKNKHLQELLQERNGLKQQLLGAKDKTEKQAIRKKLKKVDKELDELSG